jgi:predicted nuclease of predicted toxin-antitoxin system
MKILIDMNLSPRWADFLSLNGFEAIHWSEIGFTGAPDTEIMDYAAVNGYTVFTHDLDFGAALAKTHARKPSVIQVRVADLDPKMTAIPIIRLLRQNEDEIKQGALVTIDETKTRIHILPFGARGL